MNTRLAAALVTTFLGGAMASAHGKIEVLGFDELDSNGDGFLSREEVRGIPCLYDNFDRIDRNHPIGLMPTEYRDAVRRYCR
jgi:hypothetical protein